MMSSSNKPPVERAQPWLGTLVSMRVTGLPDSEVDAALHSAFKEVAQVHRLMSFHDPASDVSRMNASAGSEPVEVHSYTYAVMERALHLSALTAGCFDVTIGAEMLKWSLLPHHASRKVEHSGCWKDIELLPDSRIHLHRPVCIDLGGIAKGFAVDKATECLQQCGAEATIVNAGGDIRVSGADAAWIALAAASTPEGAPVLELENGSVASSGGSPHPRRRTQESYGPHFDGVLRCPVRADRFVSVLCEPCILADALTKVVMVKGLESAMLLRQLGATAYLHDREAGWQALENVQDQAGR